MIIRLQHIWQLFSFWPVWLFLVTGQYRNLNLSFLERQECSNWIGNNSTHLSKAKEMVKSCDARFDMLLIVKILNEFQTLHDSVRRQAVSSHTTHLPCIESSSSTTSATTTTLHLPCIESSPPPGLLFIALRSFQLDQGHQKKDQFRKTSDIRRQYGHGRFNKDTQLKMSKQTVYMSLLSQNQFYQVTVLRKLAEISLVHFYRYFWF